MHPSVPKMKTTRLNSHRRAKMQDNRAQIIQATCRVVNFSVFIAGRKHLSGDDTSRCPSNSTRISVSIKDIVLAATRNQFISCKLTEIKESFEWGVTQATRFFSAPVAIFVCRAPPRVWSRRKNVRPTSPPTNYGNDTFKCGSSNASPSSVFASVVTVTQETKYWVLGDGCHSSYKTGLGPEDEEPHSPQQHIVQPLQQRWSCMINNCMVTL